MIRTVKKSTQDTTLHPRPISISLPAEPFDVPDGPDETAPRSLPIRGKGFDLKKDSVIRSAARVKW